MPTYHGGRHEYGQNFLNDRAVINDVIALIDDTDGPIVEIGPGGGALTVPLVRLGRPLTGVEIDPRQVQRLSKELPQATLVTGDFLTYRLPSHPHVVVGNLPFHITTAVLRKLLHSGNWSHAVLIVQWEVARRRAGIGGATMMTAQWWPWFTFTVHGRIPGRAFTPSPGVDAGLLAIARRASPLIPAGAGRSYRAFVHAYSPGRAGVSGRLSRDSSVRGRPRSNCSACFIPRGCRHPCCPKTLRRGNGLSFTDWRTNRAGGRNTSSPGLLSSDSVPSSTVR